MVFSNQLRYLQHENIYIRADRFRPAFLRFPCSSSHLMLRKTPSRTDFSDVRPGSSMSMRSPSPFSSLPPLRTRMRGDSVLDSRPPSSFHSTVIAPACVQTVPTYSNRTIYRALPLEVHLFSPSIKSVTYGNPNLSRLLSVYGEHDQIQGRVIVDPSCSNTGQLVVSIEGAFCYSGPEVIGSTAPRKHIFYTAQSTLFSAGDTTPRSALRETFSIRRRQSSSQLDSRKQETSYPFAFPLPQGLRPGEELPSSFSTRESTSSVFTDNTYEVTYKVTATWQSNDGDGKQALLDAPFVYSPDTEFLSFDGLEKEPDCWLEMPLKSDHRKMPFKCAMTLPNPATFPRTGSIPYFVVFSTTPRNPSLAKEIASDASISVSLIRQIVVNEPQPFPSLPTPPDTPSSMEDNSPPQSFANAPMRRLKKIASNTNLNRSSRAVDDSWNPPQSRLPTQIVFNESKIVQSSVCLGFPKRPRHRCAPNSHPPLESQSTLPDGLQKTKITLDTHMLPCIDWGGVRVKYYLDVSVLFGQDDTRARVPVRIC